MDIEEEHTNVLLFAAPCILLQSLGVNHMKLGAEPEFRSSIRAQSVTEHPLGFARTMLEQRAALLRISAKDVKGLCWYS